MDLRPTSPILRACPRQSRGASSHGAVKWRAIKESLCGLGRAAAAGRHSCTASGVVSEDVALQKIANGIAHEAANWGNIFTGSAQSVKPPVEAGIIHPVGAPITRPARRIPAWPSARLVIARFTHVACPGHVPLRRSLASRFCHPDHLPQHSVGIDPLDHCTRHGDIKATIRKGQRLGTPFPELNDAPRSSFLTKAVASRADRD